MPLPAVLAAQIRVRIQNRLPPAHVARLTSLQELNLIDAQVSDAGLAHLGGLPSLQTLWLDRTQVTDAGLAHLAESTSLRWLLMRGTRVTDDGCDKLRQALPDCQVRH